MKRTSKSYEIALSAISCAIAAAALILGGYVDVLLGFGIIIAVFAVMIPLGERLTWGGVLCYLGAALLALPFALWRVLPFAVFFGLHPIVNFLQRSHVKKTPLKIVCLVCKTVWFDFSLWLSYFVLTSLAGMQFSQFINEFALYLIFIGGTLLFPVYDIALFYCQRSVNVLIRRIRR